jgi:hypothetical protein
VNLRPKDPQVLSHFSSNRLDFVRYKSIREHRRLSQPRLPRMHHGLSDNTTVETKRRSIPSAVLVLGFSFFSTIGFSSSFSSHTTTHPRTNTTCRQHQRPLLRQHPHLRRLLATLPCCRTTPRSPTSSPAASSRCSSPVCLWRHASTHACLSHGHDSARVNGSSWRHG